ncbi:uncharacterized protein LOC128735542 [Sabethes cyaneus]|uniref:uncharacterized protein LOC128735542 n=1 Tax=Sabethes cyaneus TaxID=53552 RepID=UPI00237EB709|nr:uncharacterized protein LOC128735542 [Sabethes cyaneus]
MIKLVIGLLFFGLVASYDFKDPFYNELLLDELLDSDMVTIDRFKRAAPEATEDKCKRQHNRHRCCNDPASSDNVEQKSDIKDLKKQCYAEVRSKDRTERGMSDPVDMFSCEKMNRTKQDMICASECIGRKKNVLDAKGNLLEPSVLIPFVKEHFASDPWQEPLVSDFVDTCMKEVAEKNAKLAPEETRCNPSASSFKYCMWRQTTLACPKEMQESSKRCDRVREKLANKEPVAMDPTPDFDDN